MRCRLNLVAPLRTKAGRSSEGWLSEAVMTGQRRSAPKPKAPAGAQKPPARKRKSAEASSPCGDANDKASKKKAKQE